MRNEERAAKRAEVPESEEAALELPEIQEKKFKFNSIFTGDGVKKGMKKIGAKNIVIVLSLLLIGAAVYINWVIFGSPKTKENDGEGDVPGNAAVEGTDAQNYFAVSALEREQARDEAMEVLQGVVEDAASMEDVKAKALADISVMAANMELEANIETLIKAKGFEDCVAVINGDAATVVVKSDGLLPNELSQILEIVYLQAKILPANVTITEK